MQIRIAFLCDMHATSRLFPCQRRILDWAGEQFTRLGVEKLVLGGDLTHRDCPCQAEAVLSALPYPHDSMIYLPGNNETTELLIAPGAYPGPQFVRDTVRLQTWPGFVFAIGATNRRQGVSAMDELVRQLPASGNVLVLAHVPPETFGEAVSFPDRSDLRIDWVCGHEHSAGERSFGQIRVHAAAGIDPIKARGTLPEALILDWDGRNIEITRLPVPLDVIRGSAHGKNPLGLAFSSSAEDVLKTALAENCSAVQFKFSKKRESDLAAASAAANGFRSQFPEGVLSIHLPSPDPETLPKMLDTLHPALSWAESMRLNDWTIHLPDVPVSYLFERNGNLVETPWARECVSAYRALAEKAIAAKVSLSLENMYNKASVQEEDELLSSRPWHLVKFVECLRHRLSCGGMNRQQTESVGILFDAGHAFRDPLVSKHHGLADWLTTIAPFLLGCHIHQTCPIDGVMTNHLAIRPLGPRINFVGLLPIIEELVPQQIPLFIEIRDRKDAIESLHALREVYR